MTEPAPDERAVDTADRLHSAAIHVLRMLRAEDAALGLTAPKLSALSVLVFRGPLSVGELAEAEQVTPATISRLVTELEARGLAQRSVDAADARVRRITATKSGIELLHAGRRRRVARLARAVAELPPAQRDALSEAVRTLEEMVARAR